VDGISGLGSADRGNLATKRSLVELFSSLSGYIIVVENVVNWVPCSSFH
jgi:hypothetical protein